MGTVSVVAQLSQAGFQIGAAIIMISCLYYTIVRDKPGKLQNKIFMVILINILITSLCDLTSALVIPYLPTVMAARVVRQISQYVYFVMHTLLSPLFCFYVLLLTGAHYTLKKKYRYLYEIPLYVAELMVITNPLTGWVYGFSEDYRYHREWGINILYMVALGYFLIAITLMLFFRKAVDSVRRRAMTYFFLMVTGGTVIQMLIPQLQMELFTEAIAMTGVMITVENEDERRNQRTGIYNHVALSRDLHSLIVTKRPFCIICIKIVNPQNLMQIVGASNVEHLTRMTAEYLSTLVPKYTIYYLTPGTFVILRENDDHYENLELSKNISDRFSHEWDFQDRTTLFPAAIFCAEVPKDFKKLEEIMSLIGSPFIPNADNKKKDVYYGNDLNFFLRRTRVEKAILDGLKNHNFEVYYQPIYDARDMSIRSGEALLRLHDADIGDIYPEEFLPVAERTGLIFELGDFVLEEVCKFLSSGIPVEMGIETLSINLSVVQCIQSNYAERIIQVISRFDIDPGRLNFEIMESAATANFEGLEHFVNTIRKYGCHFSVDDYGIGYSNIHTIFSLDVDMIKIDRSILWEAELSDTGRIIMESSTSMIKRMGKKIHISGVESKEQIEVANEFGVDYLQGFFFSNPVSQNEFIGILKATQLARVEEQRALAASEAMSNFLANMSHEIRTPINAVLGMNEMILRECEDKRIIEYARTIEGSGQTLLSLINDILDFSKIETGNMDIVEGEYNLSSVIGSVIEMIQLKMKQKELKLIVNVDPTTPEHLFGDEMRLRQIMINILNNAVKYTMEGNVTLLISYRNFEVGRVTLIITVQDTGVGIKEEELDKLFEKFQRLDQENNRTIEGSGLGLSIVSRLLELMGGEIEVESTYGSGSKFTILLPQKTVGSEKVGDFRKKVAKAKEEKPKYHENFQAPNAKILVVDDTEMNLVVVRELLKKTKLQIAEARSGQECLDMVQKEKYDVIFLDYRMPVMDGIETLRRFRELPDNLNARTPVVALTANAISGARERFLKAGFDDYMTKPIQGERLEEMLLMYLSADKIEQIKTDLSDEEKENILKQNEVDADEDENGLNMEQGIANCGSQEIYQTVFKAFRGDIASRIATLKKAFEEEDWERYGVEVHAIKSSARIIGAITLSELAKDLEQAADEQNIDFIQEENGRLLLMYDGYQHVKLPDEENGQEVTEQEEAVQKPVMTEEVWRDACQTLREFAIGMDMDNAMLILNSMRDYEMTEEQTIGLEEMETFVSQLEWDELMKVLDKILV